MQNDVLILHAREKSKETLNQFVGSELKFDISFSLRKSKKVLTLNESNLDIFGGLLLKLLRKIKSEVCTDSLSDYYANINLRFDSLQKKWVKSDIVRLNNSKDFQNAVFWLEAKLLEIQNSDSSLLLSQGFKCDLLVLKVNKKAK